MVAKLNYVFTPLPRNRSQGSNTPILDINAATVIKTTADLASSVQTDAVDTSSFLSGSSDTAVARVCAVGGAVWLEFGTNPTAVAESDGAHYLPADTFMEFALPNGYKIAAIDA
jgi:hypothetical protein